VTLGLPNKSVVKAQRWNCSVGNKTNYSPDCSGSYGSRSGASHSYASCEDIVASPGKCQPKGMMMQITGVHTLSFNMVRPVYSDRVSRSSLFSGVDCVRPLKNHSSINLDCIELRLGPLNLPPRFHFLVSSSSSSCGCSSSGWYSFLLSDSLLLIK
jgi:hypothetical protein